MKTTPEIYIITLHNPTMIKSTVLILLFICSGTIGVFAQKPKTQMPVEIGMVSYTYRHSFEKDIAKTLDTIQALGIRNMEFSNLFGSDSKSIRKMLDDRDMICTSFGVSYEALVKDPDAVAADAKNLGASFVRVAYIPHTAPFTKIHADKAIADFNHAGKILKEKHDLEFCYHNHGYEFQAFENGTYFDYIVTQTHPSYVSFEMDVLWVFHPGADPVELLEKYGDRFKLMHVKDLKKGIKGDYSGSTPVENDVALGTGQLDLPAIIDAAKNSSIKYYFIEDESPNIKTQLPQSIRYLENLLRTVSKK